MPSIPPVPRPGNGEHEPDFGRLVSERRLAPGWPCRWCGRLLSHHAGRNPANGVIYCRTCDLDAEAPE